MSPSSQRPNPFARRWLRVGLAGIGWLLSLATGLAADAPPSAASAPLTIHNREVIVFRSALLGIPATDRAQRATQRIHEQLAQPGSHEVGVQGSPVGWLVQIDGGTSFVVTDGEADASQLETAESVAAHAASVLQRIAAESAEASQLSHWLWAAGHALLATLAWLGLIWCSRRGRRLLEQQVLRVAQRHAERAQRGAATWIPSERLAAAVTHLMLWLQWLIVSLLSYEWLSYVLARFPFTRPWSEQLDAYLFGLAGQLLSATAGAVPGLFTAAVIFLLARFVVRLLNGFFDSVGKGQVSVDWLPPDLAAPTRRISNVVIWLFALTMAYPYLPGSGTEAFKGVSVLIGLMVTLGASNLVGQAASGLILTYTRVIRQGEYVRIGDSEGTVLELGMFATRVRTGLGEELSLPNALILGSVTRNYSRAVKGPGFILDTTVTIGYDTAWREVHAMLVEAAKRTPGVLHSPAPQVFQTALTDFYPEYRLVCQAIPSEPRPRAEVLNQLHANIQDVFNERGVQIMSPHYRADPAAPKLAPTPKPES